MRSVKEVKAFASVVPAEVRSVCADHDGHGFERLVVAKVAALPGEDGGDVIFEGNRSGEKKMAVAGLNLKREIGGNWKLTGTFHANDPRNQNFPPHPRNPNPQFRSRRLSQ